MERSWHNINGGAAMADSGSLFAPAVTNDVAPRFHNFNLGGKNTMLLPLLRRDFEIEQWGVSETHAIGSPGHFLRHHLS
jgi:hypothetical protein